VFVGFCIYCFNDFFITYLARLTIGRVFFVTKSKYLRLLGGILLIRELIIC
jgi:hypothetical protein